MDKPIDQGTAEEKRALILWPRSWLERVIALLGGISFFLDPAWMGIGPMPLSARLQAGIIGFLLSWLLVVVVHRGYLLIRDLFHRS